jgi:hypothetical protein
MHYLQYNECRNLQVAALCCHAERGVVRSLASPIHLHPEIWRCLTKVLIHVSYAFTSRDSAKPNIYILGFDISNGHEVLNLYNKFSSNGITALLLYVSPPDTEMLNSDNWLSLSGDIALPRWVTSTREVVGKPGFHF